MKQIILCLVALSPLAAVAQLDTVRQNEGNGRMYIKVLSDETLVEEGYLQNGALDGAWTTYHSNGEPNTIIVYSKGDKNGMVMKMTDEGRPEYIKHYKHDKLDGEQKIFNTSNSRLLEVANYSNGFKHGSYKKFYQSGSLQERLHYNKGIKTGKVEHFSEGGKLLSEVNYTNENLDGTVMNYFNDGDLKEQGSLKNDKKAGFWKEYMHSGVREMEGNFLDGEKDGEWKEYLNGILEKTYLYDKGRLVSKK